MYKLFLWLKYLRRRYLALVAVAAVMVCVFMMLTAISVMDGFLAKAEQAGKGLFGDIVVEPASITGIGRYEEFLSRLTGEYRVDGDWVVDSAEGTTLTFSAEGKLSHIEAIAGKLKPDRSVSRPGRALLFDKDRFAADLTGQLTLDTEGAFRFVADAPRVSGTLGQLRAGLSVRAVYARVGEGIPEIEAATPVINSYGLLRAGRGYANTIQIAGIRMPDRARVTNFETGLFTQKDDPHASFAPSIRQVLMVTLDHAERVDELLAAEMAKPAEKQNPLMLQRLQRAGTNVPGAMRMVLNRRAQLRVEEAEQGPARSPARIKELKRMLGEETELLVMVFEGNFLPPDNRIILGLGIPGMSFRAPTGEYVRAITPGTEVVLSLLPVGRGRAGPNVTPSTATFHIVDDAKTDVYTIDTKTVYIPFEKLQLLVDMDENRDVDDPSMVDPARCSQIQVKVRRQDSSPKQLERVKLKVQNAWADFAPKYKIEFLRADMSDEVRVQTWYDRLADFIGPIRKQRTLVALMFGVISSVAVLLIFAIFYMIVMQKIRDIGVIRAVGGSSAGVAQIFLGFGAATGLLGSILGVLLAWVFVHNINGIHDWLGRTVGFQVWTPESFLFDTIPNEMDPAVAAAVVVWAVFSGLVGALIPAVRAGIMEPAEAVRYE